MIGDGMGLTQITAGMYAKVDKLNLERIRHIGLIKTHAIDNLITDSAAGASAFACGKKTYNGAIAVDSSGAPMKTILEIAHEHGKGTGVIATSTIQHATPACFYAHQPSRAMYDEITTDFLSGTVDIAIGGGHRPFVSRKDNRNIEEEMKAMGYTFFEDLEAARLSDNPKKMILAGKGHLKSIKRGRGSFLGNASLMAIEHLQANDSGFFLVIEGSQIDWGGHSNDGEYIINEVIDFDNTVGKVLDFAAYDQNTLVIITADHETGGFSIVGGDKNSGQLESIFTTDKHTATLIPVFAFGPGAEAFSGIYENTEIFHKMVDAYGFSKVPTASQIER